MSYKEKFSYPGRLIVGEGAVDKIKEVLEGFGTKRAYVLSDRNTEAVVGARLKEMLSGALTLSSYVFPESPSPDDRAVGCALMNMPSEVDTVIGVGSGVINDIGKLISSYTGKKYVIVATAPSMDGYASATSSMCRCGCKVSIPSKLPDAIVGDSSVIATAPYKMLLSGYGDMIAKYVSICEWRISNLINGEPVSEDVAAFVRELLSECTAAVKEKGLASAEVAAMVFEGLIGTGVAMYYAGSSRPASGCEHYISHVYDMRSEAKGTFAESHGIQCAIATLTCVKLYEALARAVPDRERALSAVRAFDKAAAFDKLRELVGEESAAVMEALEEKEGKYDTEKHAARLEVILANYDKLLSVVKEELPSHAELSALFDIIGMPKSFGEAGIDESILPDVISASRDIRYKYVLSHLLFDLGLTHLYEVK